MAAVDIFTNATTTTVALSKTAPAALTQETWTVASSTGFPAASSSAGRPTLFRIIDSAAPTEIIAVINVSGTTWTVLRGYEGTTTVTHAAGFTVLNVVTAGFMGVLTAGYTPSFSVLDFGAVNDGSTDNTAAFQAALNAAAAATVTSATSPSQKVYVPSGIWVTGPITVPHRVNFEGAGVGVTRLLCKASTANNAYMITNNTTATMICVSNMSLLGNLGNQSNTVNGINFDGSGSGSEYTDMRSMMHHLEVQDFTGDGVTIMGRGVCQANAIQAWNNKGHGFVLSIDSEVSDCDAGQNGKNGFHITGNTKIANCKAWFSGYWNSGAGSVPQTASFTSGGVFGNGFHWYGSASGSVCTGLYAQDNARAGFYVSADATPTSSDRVSVSGWCADTNNNNASSTTFSNVEINDSFQVILTGGTSFDRSANTQHPAHAVLIGGAAANCTVELKTEGFTAANRVSVSGDTYQNVVQADVSLGSYGVAYAATVTPDPTSGSFIDIGALTGNITIAAPTFSANTGTPLTLMFTQDSTGGRTVTWNAVFNTTWQPTKTASATSSITFQWDSNAAAWEPISAAGGNNVLEPTVNQGTRATWTTATPTVTTTETVMMTCSIPANEMVVGSTYRCRFFCTNNATGAVTGAMRLGTTGTTSDTVVANTGTPTTLTPTAAGVTLDFEVIVQCRVTGSSGSVTSTLLGQSGWGSTYNSTDMMRSIAAAITVNTTVANKLTFTLKAASGTITSYNGYIEAL